MKVYLVYMPDGADKVEQEFPTHYRIEDSLWAVGSEILTCADVCDRLGVSEVEGEPKMIVVPMNDYYGFFDMGLWQRVSAWSRA